MKRLIEDTEHDALSNLLGQKVTFFSLNYIYTGLLVGVNEKYVELDSPSIVYETGSFDSKDWADAQDLPNTIYIMLRCVESFGLVK